MHVQFCSDLHGQFHLLKHHPNADLLIIAGDWSDGEPDLSPLMRWPVPVLFVFGNHEYYHRDLEQSIAEMRARTKHTSIHFLEQDTFIFRGVRFIGCTGWTDFGHGHPWLLLEAWQRMNDYRKIQGHKWLTTPGHREAFFHTLRKMPPHPYEPDGFHPLMAYAKHLRARDFLEETLATPFDGPTVVVTHHPPSPRSLKHTGKWLPEPTPLIDYEALSKHFPKAGWHRLGSYASRLDDLILSHQPAYWIHGHLHTPLSYFIGKTQVLCNAFGYQPKRELQLLFQPHQTLWWQRPEHLRKNTNDHIQWLQHTINDWETTDIPVYWREAMRQVHVQNLHELAELGGPPAIELETVVGERFWRNEIARLPLTLPNK